MNPEVIVTNIKNRFTGVSGTVNALLPVQARTLPIAYLGTDMPGAVLAAQHSGERFARLSFWQALRVSAKRLPDGRWRLYDDVRAELYGRLFSEGEERYVNADGHQVIHPYMGVIEFTDGLITGWRDYFQMADPNAGK